MEAIEVQKHREKEKKRQQKERQKQNKAAREALVTPTPSQEVAKDIN
jgi:hypothetical protein